MEIFTLFLLFFIVSSSAIGIPLSKRTKPSISQTVFNDLLFHVKLANNAFCNVSSGYNCTYCKEFPNFIVDRTFTTKTYKASGYIGVNPDTQEIIVAFRGSHFIMNWIEDIKFFQKPFTPTYGSCKGCKTAIGFTETWVEARSLVFTTVKKLTSKYPNFTVTVVGHSLGGAVASLCAFELKQMGGFPVKMYTYGQPRTGNSAFATAVDTAFGSQNGNSYRIVHFDDPIPRLPFTWVFDYTHHGTQYWESTKSGSNVATIRNCQGQEDPTCSDSTKVMASMALDGKAHLTYMNIRMATC